MRKIIVLLLGVIIVGCSQKPISEDEAIRIAKDDLVISEKDAHSAIIGNNSYDEESKSISFICIK